MNNTNLAYITPELITWAIDRSGTTYAQLEKSLKVSKDQITAWQQGKAHPPFHTAIDLARVLRVPFGYLFLDAPPTIEIPLPDLRTRSNIKTRQPSVDFLELLDLVIAKQEWFREYAEEHETEKLKFVSSFSINDDPKSVASAIRQTIGINDRFRREATSWANYLNLLSDNAEAAGILVMRSGVVGNDTTRALSVKEFQGFAITDEIAPLVFVNSSDFKTAQVFTLAHELAHIWTGKSGISNPDETDVVTEESKVESFCNAVAAEVLVPAADFQREWQEQMPIEKLARHFWVSKSVILRRAYELNKITRSVFFNSITHGQNELPSKKPLGGDYFKNIPTRHSLRFTKALTEDVRRGRTVFRDAARLLSMKLPTLTKFMESER